VTTITNRAAAALRKLRAEPSTTPARANRSTQDAPGDLVRRVERLEAQLEGLQDAVYRQDVVHDRQIADLRRHKPAKADATSPGLRGERS
jgi:hypothetical protein